MSRPVFFVFAVSFFSKLILSLWIPVSLDESYYYLWGQFPSLSYFDHPPMTGWIMVISQSFRGIAEGAIRWPFIVMGHGTLWVWILIAQSMMSQQKIFLFLLVALLNPLWGMGAFFATPDIPLLFFWSLSLYFCGKVVSSESLFAFIGLALSLGLAFLSKYQVVLFLPCLVLLLWQQGKWKLLLKPKTWISVVIALLVCTPVLYWNFNNDWASFDFQWNHGMDSKYWKWTYPIEYIATQFFLIFPVFFIFIFGRDQNWRSHWLLPFAVFPYLFFLYSSFKGRVEANWVIMSFPPLYALAMSSIENFQLKKVVFTLRLWAVLFVAALLLPIVKTPDIEKNIKLFEAEKFSPILKSINDDKKYLTYSYQLSGYLSFKKGRLFCKLPKYGRMDHMDFIDECKKRPDHFFYITEWDQNPSIHIDFPGWKKIGEIKVNETYKIIEIKKI